MRLYVLDQISLRALAEHVEAPRPGDVVSIWRHAQAVDEGVAVTMRARGITVRWAEDLVDSAAAQRIDTFIDRFGRQWHWKDGRDVTVADGFSFGDTVTRDLHGRAKISFLVRYGYIFEQLFSAYPAVREVLTDFLDGVDWRTGNRPAPHAFQRRQLLYDQAKLRGLACRDLPVEHPIPVAGFHGRESVYRRMVRSFVGGFRPRFVAGRMRLRWAKKRRPRIYLFEGFGLGVVIEALGRRSDVETISDGIAYPDVLPLRFDHFLALPPAQTLKAIWRLWRIAWSIEETGFRESLATFGTIDYTSYFCASIRHLVRYTLGASLIGAGQMNRMLRLARPDVVVINGEGAFSARLAVAFARKFGYRTVHVDHSHTLVEFGYHPYGRNYPDVIYVAQGEDHIENYGRRLPENGKPRRPVLTNPATTEMDRVRGRRRQPSGKHVLLTNYSNAMGYSVRRIAYEDRYVIDVFEAARRLIPEGYRFTYRSHPGYGNRAYIDYLLDQMKLTNDIRLDSVKTFSESLLDHDLVVANVSGCLYQAFYAGWPTIFYEPNFDPDNFVGLPAATDIERPIASTPERLVEMIEDGLTRPDSLTARFPELFGTDYEHRFIGRGAQRAADVLSGFLVEGVLGGKCSAESTTLEIGSQAAGGAGAVAGASIAADVSAVGEQPGQR